MFDKEYSIPVCRYSVVFVLSVLTVSAFCFLRNAAFWLAFPYDVMYCSRIAYNLYLFVNGTPLYEHYCSFPEHITLYTPLYYVFVSAIAKLGQVYSYMPLLFLSRLVTFSCSLLSAALIFFISLRLKYGKATSAIASLLFLGNPILYWWGFSSRVDLMALSLSLFALYMVLVSEKRLYLAFALFFALASFYTKQSYFCASLAIAFHLCSKKKFRLALEFTSLYLIVGCVIFLWLNYITGWAFYLNSIVGAILVVPHYLHKAFNALDGCGWKVVPVFLLVPLSLYKIKGLHPLVIIYAFFSYVTAAVSSSGIWSAENYWLEALAPSVLIAAPLVSRLSIRKDKIVTVVLLPLFLFAYLRYPVAYFRGRLASVMESTAPSSKLVVEFLKQTKGEVFYDGDPDLLIRSGKNVFSADWSSYILLVRKNKCADLEMVERIRNKGFSCLIFHEGYSAAELTTGIEEAIKNNYRINRRIGSHEIFTPLAKGPKGES
jgi:hypothetical protein